ncbi:gastrula zinc finger protein XlCGF49.1-like [Syngnathoides biaculeatus]|uniref:gastrula zinc finger protein XlCGF49.1-like n=1 Tax=Syngnathoides biaculeatus TaxID=300417 RepID=UPI002ADE40D4|nr:gastrula zinc finger protein XlCGF49.1-like [Syngnathoides biaculeatus]
MEEPSRSDAHCEDFQQEPQPTHVKEEEEATQPPNIKEEEEETDVSKLLLTRVFVKNEDQDQEPESSQFRGHSPNGVRCGGPLSDSEGTEEPLRNNIDCGMDERPTSCSTLTMEYSQMHKIRVTCSVCSKTFATKQTLRTHKRRHTGEKPFSCQVCKKAFSQKGSIQLHMKTHTGEKPFSCSVCGKSFSHKENLVTHRRKHTGEKPFPCPDCGKTFTRKVHVTKIHTGAIPFSCSICGESYGRRASLTEHMRKHNAQSK